MTISTAEWKLIFGWMDAALNLPEHERQAWLAATTEIPAGLKATLRELLLRGGASGTTDFLPPLPHPALAGAPLLPAVAQRELTAGLVIGPYRLIHELGRGGMGAVWLAERTDGQIKRNVALKLPYADGPYSRRLAERFAAERDILAQLTHPNIARLYDAGVATDGQPFLALEFVEGKPITEYCERNTLSIAGRVLLFQQVLEAVQYAHANLVLHRDLKPSNILVTADKEVKLLDFGIAKLMTADEGHESALTVVGGRPLTPHYASPEQIAGAPINTASDVYSLGVLLYELFTGERPHHVESGGRVALEQTILTTRPERPSSKIVAKSQATARATTLTRLKKSLSGDLDTIVLKALKKSPSERYATVDAFAQDIRRYVANEPILTRADSYAYRLRKFVARNKVAAGAAAVIVLAVTAGLIGTLTQAQLAARQRDLALAALERAEIVTDFFRLLINDAPPDSPITIGEIMSRAESLADKEFADTPEHQAAILGVLGEQYTNDGNFAKALPLLDKAAGLLASSNDTSLRTDVICLRGYAMAAAKAGREEQAVREINQALAYPGTGAKEAAECLNVLSRIARDQGKKDDAYEFAKLALERLRESTRRDPRSQATLTQSLANAQAARSNNAEANRLYASTLEQLAALGRERTVLAITTRSNWAVMCLGAGDIKTGLAQLDLSLQLSAQRATPKLHAAILSLNHARALESSGRYAEAIAGFHRAVEAGRAAVPPHGPIVVALATSGLVSAHRELGELDQANIYLARTRQLVHGNFPPESPPSLALAVVTGKMAASLGRLDQAYEAFSQILEGPAKSALPPAMRVSTLLQRSEVLLQQGRLAEAIADARLAERGGLDLQGGKPYSSFTGRALLLQGKILQSQGDAVGARNAFQPASEHLLNAAGPDLPETKQATLLRASAL